MAIEESVKTRRSLFIAATVQAQSLRMVEFLKQDEAAVTVMVFPSDVLLRFIYSLLQKALPASRMGVLIRGNYPYEKRQVWQQWAALQ